MDKAQATLRHVSPGIFLVMFFQLRICGINQGTDVAKQEFHFLYHSTPHDSVVLIQVQGYSFAIEYLLADKTLNKIFQLGFIGQPVPLFLVYGSEVRDILYADAYHTIFTILWLVADQGVQPKQRGPNEKKQEKRFL
jgi:hypothetical protein